MEEDGGAGSSDARSKSNLMLKLRVVLARRARWNQSRVLTQGGKSRSVTASVPLGDEVVDTVFSSK